MATRKSSQSSATATAATTSANAEAQDDAVATSAASTPSGTNGPDGTNSINTPQSSGDAAEEASANSVNTQTNAENAETTTVEAANGTSTPETEASVSGTSSDASQGETDGAGANAGSDQLIAELTLFMDASGLTEFEQVVRVAEIGRNVLAEIELISIGNPEVARWLTDENPAGIIRELSDQVGYLSELLEDRTSPSDLTDKRRFLITKTIRLNNVLHEENEGVWLTFDEHALAFAVNACEPDWRNGGTPPR
ncbi:hypothetical protein [Agrobacterium sp. SORGH_AS 787]|uniref:hypothetical protein n=1 Tax=Agrobacterium sp. SORGH_AS 787 TaxID=3041775 RepID=UPI0027867E97|nr:hypothetical protein [Rhizobium sp. SORGH_AS_0787]